MFKGKKLALMVDPDGFIAEGSGDNFFIVKNNIVITPEGRNCLVGISRNYIFEICKQLKIRCIEKNIEPYDVYTADEAFMTGTPFCILPVFRFNGINVGKGEFGPISKKLLKRWSKNVGLDIIKQIKDFGKECKDLSENFTTPYQFSNKSK